ncbi:MAG: sigma-70 family RNA polymerase sigma factor [Pirellula sp.]|jgi:RNA polymerase sigma-70 factor (ECF subfamily)|nr:sigma-70 family RNA polymerase sigma factor [Pirellula sp.]
MNGETLTRDRPLAPEIVERCVFQYQANLERYAWAIVRDWSLAKDATQNGFILLSRFGGDVTPEAIKSWLFKVVHREALRLRESQRMQPCTDLVAEPASRYESTPLTSLIEQERLELVRNQIDQLPPDQQTILRMRIVDERSFHEIAATLSIPLGTALSRMRLALEKLRKQNNEPAN